MSSASDTDDSSFTESSYLTEDISCALPRQPCVTVPGPVRRLVDVKPPSQARPYDFTVLYNDRVPTGSRIEIKPQQRRVSFKPNFPQEIPDRDLSGEQMGDAFSPYFRREMRGFDPVRNNGNASELDRFSPHPYPFPSQDSYNTRFDYLGVGPQPHLGRSHVTQGMGDVSQQILENFTGAKGFQQPKREVEQSHPRNIQLPVHTPDFGDWQQRYAMSLKDTKPFELPFQQGRDSGDRTMPFGSGELHPPLRILPNVSGNKQNMPLPVRVNNIPSQAQSNPNPMYMQGLAELPEYREPMFDNSSFVRTPSATPTQNYQPPLMQAPVRITPTNRSDTNMEWRGPIHNSSADLTQMDQIYTQLSRTSIEENPLGGPIGNMSAGTGGYLAAVPYIPDTQRGGDEWTTGAGPAWGGGQTPMQYSDEWRPTLKQALEEVSQMPRVVRSGIGARPMEFSDVWRDTTKQTLSEATIMAPMQNPSGGARPLEFNDEFRPTLKQTLAEVVIPPVMQNPSGGARPLEYDDIFRPTTKQTTSEIRIQPGMQNPSGGARPLEYDDIFRPTTKQTTAENRVQPGMQNPSGGARPLDFVDDFRPTTRQTTEQTVFPANISGEATGKAPIRQYDDEWRDTRRQFTENNPELGPAYNSSAGAGGYLATDVYAPLTERNLGLEETYSFGPVSAGMKSPTDRSYLRNLTFDDRKEVGLYNRVPGRSQNRAVPRNVYGNWSLPPDDDHDPTRTANPNMSHLSTGRVMPAFRYSDTKDQIQVNEFRFIEPYQTSQLRVNPYATDVRVIAGQPQY